MRMRMAIFAGLGALALSGCTVASAATEKTVEAPEALVKAQEPDKLRVAIFAGGCFWGVEGVFSHVKGVKAAVSGYHGGRVGSATYRQVVTGFTDHAESVRIVYDPAEVRYDELLQILFSVVTDPTLLNRQGPDVGAHYRSAIVPMNKEQARVARAYLKQLEDSNVWGAPVVTAIEPYKAFYEAEGYHQDFMLKNPGHGYIVRWDKPKVEALQKLYPEHYRASFLRDHTGE
jgi:peptide-methionine (S)-S-oxide reductase